MKRYDEKVLEYLLDRYERSLLYTGKNKTNRTISMTVSPKTLPEYFDESALQYEVIHQQLEKLEAYGYVRLVWKNKKKGHILEKCELNLEYLDEAYGMLRRKPKMVKEQEILDICGDYQGKAKELDPFLEWVRKRIQGGESIQKYADIDTPRDFGRLCQLILSILNNDSECFLRQFSVRHFHDSKAAEKDIGRAVRIITEFSEKEKFADLETEEILAEYNIYRNPSWLMMKGNVKIQVRSGDSLADIELRLFGGGLGISNQDIENICWDPASPIEKVVTVENLTSFHQWTLDENAAVLCIYLGGYHNQVKRLFLHKLYRAYPDAEYRHFGDIDCGGFRIWKDLCVKTGIPFIPLHMDLTVYDKYFLCGRKLTEQDKKTLSVMMKDPFFHQQAELFARMLQQGMKVEQECVEAGLEEMQRDGR